MTSICIPNIFGLLLGLGFTFIILKAVVGHISRDLGQDCSKWAVTAAVWLGVFGGVGWAVLDELLSVDHVALGNACRQYYGNTWPDVLWGITDVLGRGQLLAFCGIGLFLAWFGMKTWKRGIQPDKSTFAVAGLVAGLGVGFLAELSRVYWGDSRQINRDRIALFCLLGIGLFLASRPFLVHEGRFRFGIRGMMGVTLVWAVVMACLSPQWSRYDREERAIRQVEAILDVPVETTRHVGFVGLRYAYSLTLPKTRIQITREQVAPLVEQLHNLTELNFIDGNVVVSKDVARTLNESLPQVHFKRLTVE